MISGASVPPAEEFCCAICAILNHPSIPLHIFPSMMRLLNSVITSKDSDIAFAKPFNTCRDTTKNDIDKLFPDPKAKSMPFNQDKEFQESSLEVIDIKEMILQEAQNPDLWFSNGPALKGNEWEKHIPESNSKGMINLSDAILGTA